MSCPIIAGIAATTCNIPTLSLVRMYTFHVIRTHDDKMSQDSKIHRILTGRASSCGGIQKENIQIQLSLWYWTEVHRKRVLRVAFQKLRRVRNVVTLRSPTAVDILSPNMFEMRVRDLRITL